MDLEGIYEAVSHMKGRVAERETKIQDEAKAIMTCDILTAYYDLEPSTGKLHSQPSGALLASREGV